MARKTYRVGMSDEILEPTQKELETKPQVQEVDINDEKIIPNLKETSSSIYQIKVNHPSLRRRENPSTSSEVKGLITDEGTYNVYNESDGWAQLEDGTWVMLQFCSKIE